MKIAHRIHLMLAVICICLVVILNGGLLADAQAGSSSPPAQGFTVHGIAAAARDFVRHRISAPNDSVEIQVDLPQFSVTLDQISDFRFDLPSRKAVAGTVPLRVTLVLRDGTDLAFAGTARVRIYDTVAVTDRRLGRHQTIEPDHIRFERCEVTLLPDGYFTDPDQVAGKRAKRVLSAGSLVRISDVEPVPVIERGSAVTVVVIIGGVTVTSKAKALEDGAMGQAIRIKDVTTGKRLTATVRSSRLVIVDDSIVSGAGSDARTLTLRCER
jgi:flagella basal body P-ring formation protein FlgA